GVGTEATRQGRLVKERATVVGRVLLERATVQIPDVRADPDYDNTRSLDFIAALSGTPARTILGVPIVKGAALVGIVIARRNEVSPFSPREIDVLETFARQAAVAVENVRLFNETKEVLERRTIHIPDVESEAANAFPVTRERFAALGQRAVLVAPLLREGSPIGTIALRKREPIPFTPNQIRLVEAFADQAVIAIENVR